MERERTVWRIARGTEDLTLLRSSDLRADEAPVSWGEGAAHRAVSAWWLDGGARLQLTMIAMAFGAFDLGDEAAVRARLARLIESGVVAVLRRPYEPLPQTERPDPNGPQPGGGGARPEEKTWIEVQLLTPEGQPVVNRRVRIELPDRSVIERTTDAQGLCRADGIDPGTCKVTLLDVDRAAWRPQ